MRRQQDRAAGRLVDAARLHADKAVLDEVEPADAVLAAELVELGQQRGRRRASPSTATGSPRTNSISTYSGLSGACSGATVRLIDDIPRARPTGLPAPCPRPRCAAGWRRPKTAPRRACPWRSGLVLLGVVEEAGARGQIPFAPRRDDLDVGLQRVIGQLEADLVVALAGRAMGDRVGADLARDLDLALGDQRPGDRGAEQICALVKRVGAEHREDKIADEFLAQILDEDLLDAQKSRPSSAPARAPRPGPKSAVKVTTSQR